jgi:hypothetical protein
MINWKMYNAEVARLETKEGTEKGTVNSRSKKVI